VLIKVCAEHGLEGIVHLAALPNDSYGAQDCTQYPFTPPCKICIVNFLRLDWQKTVVLIQREARNGYDIMRLVCRK
jgi:hypothetical protein